MYLRKSEDNTKWVGVLVTQEGHAAIINTLEKWADRNHMKFSNKKCKVLQLGRHNPRHNAGGHPIREKPGRIRPEGPG